MITHEILTKSPIKWATVRHPTFAETKRIIIAQAKYPSRKIIGVWQQEDDGSPAVRVTLKPSAKNETVKTVAQALIGVDRLIIESD